jgi:hypothetical protein
MPGEHCRGAIDLLEQDDLGERVRQGERREPQQQRRLVLIFASSPSGRR